MIKAVNLNYMENLQKFKKIGVGDYLVCLSDSSRLNSKRFEHESLGMSEAVCCYCIFGDCIELSNAGLKSLFGSDSITRWLIIVNIVTTWN